MATVVLSIRVENASDDERELKKLKDCLHVWAEHVRPGLQEFLGAIVDGTVVIDEPHLPPCVLVHLSGGCVQDVYCENAQDVGDIVIRDFDIQGSEVDEAEDGNLFLFGDDSLARETSYPIYPFSDLETKPFNHPVDREELRQLKKI